MAFIGDVLETAHRIGELRHCRRLRKAEQQRAGREAAGMKEDDDAARGHAAALG
jgi:hypothetical protein